MKKNTKKWAIALLSLAFTLGGAFGLAACGDKEKEGPTVTFENWQATQTVTAPLGSVYQLTDLSITDTEGNVYYYDVEIKDKDGNVVPLIGGRFSVDKAGDYTLTYTLTISDTDVRVRTVTLKAQDETPPVISVDLKTGFLGEEYQIPTINVEDTSGETITPTYKVFFEEIDGSQTEIDVENGAFTPNNSGKYILDVEAVDSNGNKAEEDFVFAVRDWVDEVTLEDFSCELSLLNSTNANQEWLEEFQGREGVLHIKGTDSEKTAYFFRFIREAAFYKHTPFNSITIRLYLPKYADVYQTTTPGALASWTGLNKGQWINYEITQFVDWNYLFECATGPKGAQLFWTWTRNTDIYIDEIVCSVTPDVQLNTSVVGGIAQIGETVEVSASVPNDDRLDVALEVTAPSGGAVTITDGKITLEESGVYTAVASIQSAEFPYYNTTKTFTFVSADSYVKVDENHTPLFIGSVYDLPHVAPKAEYTLPVAQLFSPATNGPISATIDVSVSLNGEDIHIADGKFTPDREGVYRITYTTTHDGKTYKTECDLLAIRSEKAENELALFESEESAAQFSYGPNGQAVAQAPEWIGFYEGRAGVVKMNTTKTDGYTAKIDMTYDELVASNWKYMEIHIFVKGIAGKSTWMFYGNLLGSGAEKLNGDTPYPINAWRVITIDRSKYDAGQIDNFMKALTGSVGAQICWGYDVGEIYFDKIVLDDPETENILENFDDANCIDRVSYGADGMGAGDPPVWLESFAGKNGVVKLNASGLDGYTVRGFKTYDRIMAGDWRYIDIEIYVTGVSGADTWLYWGSQLGEGAVNESEAWVTGEWKTLTIDSKAFTDTQIKNFIKAFAGKTGAHLFWGYDVGEVYIDSITVRAE